MACELYLSIKKPTSIFVFVSILPAIPKAFVILFMEKIYKNLNTLNENN